VSEQCLNDGKKCVCVCVCVIETKSKVLRVTVNGGDCSVALNVTFCPLSTERCTANIYISIRHNIYDDTVVQLIGEGYLETITIDDLSCWDDFDPPLNPPPPPSALDEDDAVPEDGDTPGLMLHLLHVHCFSLDSAAAMQS